MKKIIVVLSIIFVAASCKSHLDREDAKKQILKSGNYPIIKDYDFPKEYNKDYNTQGNGVTLATGGEEWENKKKAIENFEKKGLITFEETPHEDVKEVFLLGRIIRTWTSVKVQLTAKGEKSLLEETDKNFTVQLWETDFNEVTGIQEMEQEKTAIVDYTIANKRISPFGECFSDNNITIPKKSYFSKFDDGWRIK